MARISLEEALSRIDNYRSNISIDENTGLELLNEISNVGNLESLLDINTPPIFNTLEESIQNELPNNETPPVENAENRYSVTEIESVDETPTSTENLGSGIFEDNILSSLDNYTYNIELFIVDPIYQNVGFDIASVPNKIILASSKASGRYFIDNLTIETVPAIKEQSRLAQAISFSFEITEPRGFSFIDAVIESANSLGLRNHRFIPYFLKLEFVAYDSNGVPIGSVTTPKYYSILIKNIESISNSEGTVYSVTGYPFDHIGQTNQQIITRTNLRIEGTSTIGEFFDELQNQLDVLSTRIDRKQFNIIVSRFEKI